MQLNPVASAVLVGFYLVASLLLIGLIGAAAFLLARLNTTLEMYQARIDPLLDKADVILTVATEKVTNIGEKTEALLSDGEGTAASVGEKVEQTAGVVQHTINAPIIGVNALVAGVTRGLATFGRLQKTATGTVLPKRATRRYPAGNDAAAIESEAAASMTENENKIAARVGGE